MNNLAGRFRRSKVANAENRIEVVSSVAVRKSMADPGQVNNIRFARLRRNLIATRRWPLPANYCEPVVLKQRVNILFPIFEGRSGDRIEVGVYCQDGLVHFFWWLGFLGHSVPGP